jgi:cytoskeletal protein CcmA (bactofilin family)
MGASRGVEVAGEDASAPLVFLLRRRLFTQSLRSETIAVANAGRLRKLRDMSNVQSRLGKDIEISGTLKFKGELLFEGKFRGTLVEGSSLVIAEGAEVHAKSIVVENLTSSGLVDGDAAVSQRCQLKSTAHLQGSLKTFRLAMEDGATFAGALEISKPANIGSAEPVK